MKFASNKIITKWGKLRLKMSEGNVESMFQLEELLKEIREDLGHTNRGL